MLVPTFQDGCRCVFVGSVADVVVVVAYPGVVADRPRFQHVRVRVEDEAEAFVQPGFAGRLVLVGEPGRPGRVDQAVVEVLPLFVVDHIEIPEGKYLLN